MDILYVVGTGSSWDNNELRYSLRSIAKYGRNIERVYLVGYKPNFVSSMVNYLPCEDIYNRKHKNIMYKVLTAMERTDISNHFLISSDDHFYVRETDFDNYPVYFHKGELQETYSADKLKNRYYLSLIETRALLLKYSLPILKTNPHCNTHFRKDIYQRNKYLFDEAMTLKYGGELNCLMGNLLVKNGVEPKIFNDSKLTSAKYKDKDMFLSRMKEVECISMNDKSLEWGMGDYLQSLFPNKCIYER